MRTDMLTLMKVTRSSSLEEIIAAAQQVEGILYHRNKEARSRNNQYSKPTNTTLLLSLNTRNSNTTNNRLRTFMINILPLSTKTRFQFIKKNYDYNSYKLYQAYENTTLKLVRLNSDLNYLYQCKSNNLIPKFLRFKLANPELANTRSYCKCQNLLLDEEIYSKKCKIKYMSRIQMNLYNELEKIFLSCVMRKIDYIINEVQSKEDRAKYRTHCKKFNKLINFRYLQQQLKENQRELLDKHPMNQFINKKITHNDNNDDKGDNDNNDDESKIVRNLSDRELTEEEFHALEKGLSFNRRGTINRSEVISDVEYLFHQASGIQKEATDFQKWDENPDSTSSKEIRRLEPRQLSLAADLKTATEKFFSQAQLSIKRRRNINVNGTDEDQLLLNLSKDPSIVITRPDKGKGVVIMNRTDYIQKLEQILSDTSKFRLVVEKDPTGRRETALTSLLRKMKNEEWLTESQYRYIKPVGSIPTRLYGLPKVYKDNVPLRPIVSCIQSYNYRLGKFLADIIKPIRDSTYSLKNNDAFLKFLKENSSLSNNKMFSFDIESLFTNIPVHRTIDIICNKLYCTDPLLRPYIPEHYFRQLLEYATEWTHFLFNNKYYDQCDGVSMGTPLAAIFAEVFMADFEEQHLPALLNDENSKLLVWRRYVDDTFTIVKVDADKEKCRQLLNTLDPCIKFTIAPEVDNTIAFLDVLVKRHDKGFDTTVYRKETATKLMLKWNSLIPTAYKRASIYPLVDRAIRICSRPDLLHDELLYIRKMAQFNGYSSSFVQNIINKLLNQFYQPQVDLVQLTPTENKKYKYVQIPYIGAPSYIYGKRLKSIIQQNNPTSDLRVIYKTQNETRRYFPTKDKLTKNQKSGVVYQISCFECNKTYIGKTIRQSYRRLNEHEKDAVKAIIFVSQAYSLVRQRKQIQQHINNKNGHIQKKPSTQPLRRSARLFNKQTTYQSQQQQDQADLPFFKPKSALEKHAFQTGHSINFTDINILNQDQIHYRLQVKESIRIRSKRPVLNGTDTSVPLYVFPEGCQTNLNK